MLYWDRTLRTKLLRYIGVWLSLNKIVYLSIFPNRSSLTSIKSVRYASYFTCNFCKPLTSPNDQSNGHLLSSEISSSIYHKNESRKEFSLRLCLARSKPHWRRGRDSNPREIALKLISSQPRYDHFDTSPYFHRKSINIILYYSTINLSKLQYFFENSKNIINNVSDEELLFRRKQILTYIVTFSIPFKY